MRTHRWQFVLASLLCSMGCTATLNSTPTNTAPQQHTTHVLEGTDLFRVVTEESTTRHWLFGEQKSTRIVEKIKLEPGSSLPKDDNTP